MSGAVRLGAALGQGGACEVYAGVEVGTGRQVAVRQARDADAEPMLLAQYAASVGLRHPNVAETLQVGRDRAGRLFVLQSLVEGPLLTHRLPLPADSRRTAALGIARGLAAIHGWGTVHGDLSPDNIMLDGGVNPVLIDWGLTPEQTGNGYGTPGYIAPEVLRGGPASQAADVYAAGCVLFEIWAGQPLFADVTAGLRAHQHLSVVPEMPADLDDELAALLRAALAKDPGARPSAHQLVEWLEGWLEVEGDPALVEALLSLRGPAEDPVLASLNLALARHADGLGSVLVLSAGGDAELACARWFMRQAVAHGGAVWVEPGGGHDVFVRLSTVTEAGVHAAPDPVMTLARALDRMAAEQPLAVVVDGRAADSGELGRAWEALTTAAGAAPIVALVLAPAELPLGKRDQRCALTGMTAAGRVAVLGSVVADPSAELSALVAGLDGAGAAGVVQTLRQAAELGALLYRAGQWLCDAGRLAGQQEDIRAAASHSSASVEALPILWLRVLAALDTLGCQPTLDGLARALCETPAALEAAVAEMGARGLVGRARRSVRLRDRRLARESYLHLNAVGRTALHSGLLAELRPSGSYVDQMLFRGLHGLLAGAPATLSDAIALVDELVGRRQLRWAAHVIDTLEQRAWSAPDATATIQLARARLLVSQGDTAAARACLGEVAPANQETLVCLGEQLIRCGAYEDATQALDGKVESPAAQLTLARSLLYTGKSAEAQMLAEDLERGQVSNRVYAGACHLRATCLWHSGRAEEAEAVAVEGLEAAGEDRALRADLFRATGIARFYRADYVGAREALAQATTENRAMGRIPELAKCLNNLAMVDYGRGEWARAAETWEEFKLLCSRIGDPVELANACNNLGYLRLRLGEHHRAIALYQRCLQVAEDAGYNRLLPVARSNMAEALLWLGDLEPAGDLLDHARDELARTPNPQVAAELERRWAEWLLADGQILSALVHARSQLDEAPEGAEVGHLHRVLAECFRRTSDIAEAEEHARLAVSTFEARDARFDLALAREGLARVLTELGRPFEAAQEARLALDTFLELGARAHADAASEMHRCLVRTTMQSPKDLQAGRALVEVALQLGATLDLEQLVPMVLERVVQIVNAERGLFALYGEDGDVREAVLHNLTWAGPGHPLPVSSSVLNQARLTGRVVVVQDVETEGDYQSRISVRLLGLRSMLGVPVLVDGRVVGVIYVDSRKETIQDIQRDVELLGALAGLVGVCVENARLFAEHRLRTDLLATMAHDFRAPLSVIQVNAGMLTESQQTVDDREMLAEIAGGAMRMLRMIDNALELSSDGQNDEPVVPLDLDEGFVAHVNQLAALADTYQLRIDCQLEPGLAQIHTRPERLRVVLDNLVFNAIKFARPGSTVTISARRCEVPPPRTPGPHGAPDGLFRNQPRLVPTAGAELVEFSVHNEGRPIPEEVMARLFQPFNREAVRARGVRSTGLGLAIAHRCVRQLGGQIRVESNREVGTRFTFVLPTQVELASADVLSMEIPRAAG